MNKIYRQGTVAAVWGNHLQQRGEENVYMKKKIHINKAWGLSWREAGN